MPLQSISMKHTAIRNDESIANDREKVRELRRQQKKEDTALAKSDLLRYLLDQADMILDGRPPTRVPPPTTYYTISRWTVAELEAEMCEKFDLLRGQRDMNQKELAEQWQELEVFRDMEQNFISCLATEQEDVAAGRQEIGRLEEVVKQKQEEIDRLEVQVWSLKKAKAEDEKKKQEQKGKEVAVDARSESGSGLEATDINSD